MNSVWIWLGIAVALGVVELLTLELIFLMFAVGALGGAASGALGAGVPLQIVIAAVISAIGLFFVRPIAMRYLKKSSPETLTNVEALIGQPVRIMEPVGAHTGVVQINGETWSARPLDPAKQFAVGDNVVVSRVDGAYLIIDHASSAQASNS